MKTLKEIIKGLDRCTCMITHCDTCPYYGILDCQTSLKLDAKEALKQFDMKCVICEKHRADKGYHSEREFG